MLTVGPRIMSRPSAFDFLRDGLAFALHELGVPRGRHGNAGGERSGLDLDGYWLASW